MAKTITERQLRNESVRILREVHQGEIFRIVVHGEVIAVLTSPDAVPRLRIRPARRRGGFTNLPRVRLDHPVQEILDDLRGRR